MWVMYLLTYRCCLLVIGRPQCSVASYCDMIFFVPSSWLWCWCFGTWVFSVLSRFPWWSVICSYSAAVFFICWFALSGYLCHLFQECFYSYCSVPVEIWRCNYALLYAMPLSYGTLLHACCVVSLTLFCSVSPTSDLHSQLQLAVFFFLLLGVCYCDQFLPAQ